MAVINDGEDILLFYRYRIKEFFMIIDNETIEIEPTSINSILIIDDYINNLYPIMKLDIGLSKSMYYKIIKNKDKVQFKLYIQSFFTKNNTLSKKSAYSKVISDTFSLILDDDEEFLSEELNEKEYSNSDTDMNAITVTCELFLFKKSILKNSRVTVNKILTNCDVTTALSWLFTKLNLKNLLMQKADNRNKYTMMIPPLTIGNAIQWIDTFYGIYETGSIIYIGITKSYVLKFASKSKAFEDKERQYVSIIIPKLGGSVSDTYCQLDKKGDTSKYYVIADPQSFDPKQETKSGSIINEEDIEVISSKSGEVIDKSSDTKNTKVILSKVENPYISKTYKAQVNSGASVIQVILKDMDLSMITPNKIYQFIFEDTKLSRKYKGNYFLCSRELMLIKESKYFKVNMNCTFRKII